jgi:hypothetical protein
MDHPATAWHEAGHALVAHLCGRIVTAVSATPHQHYRGVTTLEPGRSDALPTFGLPMILQPTDHRVDVETTCTILLAGPAAEQVYLEHRARTALTEAAATTPDRPVAIRTPDVETRLQTHLDDVDRPDVLEDATAAWTKVKTLTAVEDLARAVLDLCEQQALHLLRSRLPVLHRIASALQRHGDLTGTDLLDLIEGTDHAS